MLETFVKIYSRILSSSIRKQDHATRLLWFSCLLMADKNGIFHGTYDFIAAMAALEIEEVEKGMKILMSPDEDSGLAEEEGRRILPLGGHDYKITNYEYYRDLAVAEERREKDRLRKSADRANKSKGCPQASENVRTPYVYVSVSDTDTKDIKEEALRRFETFWDLYGKKISRVKCESKWQKMTEEEQLKAIEVLPRHKKLWDTYGSYEYVPHPLTWINQKKWEDEITDEMLNPVRKNKGFTPRGMGCAKNFTPKF